MGGVNRDEGADEGDMVGECIFADLVSEFWVTWDEVAADPERKEFAEDDGLDGWVAVFEEGFDLFSEGESLA